jgi:hypothetical protein
MQTRYGVHKRRIGTAWELVERIVAVAIELYDSVVCTFLQYMHVTKDFIRLGSCFDVLYSVL